MTKRVKIAANSFENDIIFLFAIAARGINIAYYSPWEIVFLIGGVTFEVSCCGLCADG